ncbi:MAG: metallophosphoesterase family protein [Ktedonobacteraceae bacterium]|nr:metallophosphoesterase family protein [Ktedonobacteraceae bacterium]
MRYAIFTDIHANLEALETVLAKVDELAKKEPIDQIWFLGDLVGYGPNPNECIVKLRERTDVIIAGNHDWAAVGKIDLEDFSEAARISAEWTAQQLTEEHRTFLTNLPERLEIDDCTLVHGSPYGPLWEYLTSEVLAERSFQYFATRFCFVGHTHVPIIFQQPDTIATEATHPLANEQNDVSLPSFDENGEETHEATDDDDTTELAAVRPQQQTTKATSESASVAAEFLQNSIADATDEVAKIHQQLADDAPEIEAEKKEANVATTVDASSEETAESDAETDTEPDADVEEADDSSESADDTTAKTEITSEETIQSAEDRLNEEIEELLALLGLSQSMVNVTNEMVIPPEGDWQAPDDYRAIVNPGGVGQPRDGDPRASFMIYDTEHGITFYRIPYPFEKTQQKIIKVGLPRYLATRLAYGR